MPGSIRTLDATAQRFDPADDRDDLPLTTNKANLVERGRAKHRVSLIQLPPSPADSDPSSMPNPSATTLEERRITRPIDRGAPGDQAIFSENKTPNQRELTKRKSQYYGDAFAYREPNSSARERVSRESMIMADIRTNVIVSRNSF